MVVRQTEKISFETFGLFIYTIASIWAYGSLTTGSYKNANKNEEGHFENIFYIIQPNFAIFRYVASL